MRVGALWPAPGPPGWARQSARLQALNLRAPQQDRYWGKEPSTVPCPGPIACWRQQVPQQEGSQGIWGSACGWGGGFLQPGAIPSAPTAPCPGPPSQRRSFPPPCSCWEWRLHFSCHLHSQSIRTPQLSRLAELGGRRRRNGSSGGCRLSTAPIPPQIASCSAAVRSQGGSGNPWRSFSLLGTRDAREPSFSAGPAAAAGDRQRRGEGRAARRRLHWLPWELALRPPLQASGSGATSSPPPSPETRRRGQGLGRKGLPSPPASGGSWSPARRRESCHL